MGGPKKLTVIKYDSVYFKKQDKDWIACRMVHNDIIGRVHLNKANPPRWMFMPSLKVSLYYWVLRDVVKFMEEEHNK